MQNSKTPKEGDLQHLPNVICIYVFTQQSPFQKSILQITHRKMGNNPNYLANSKGNWLSKL